MKYLLSLMLVATMTCIDVGNNIKGVRTKKLFVMYMIVVGLDLLSLAEVLVSLVNLRSKNND